MLTPVRVPLNATRRVRLLLWSALFVCTWAVGWGCGGDTSAPTCNDASCDQPPATVCLDGVTVRYSPFGTCLDGRCDYAPTQTTCEFGCNDSATACLATAPCPGACEAPPAAACDGDELVQYAGPGTCDVATLLCDYPTTRQDCAAAGRICRDGACVPACQGVTCPDPAPSCEGDVAIVQTNGRCDAGDCLFDRQETDCAARNQLCFEGACADPDLCLEVTCDAPPAPRCDGFFAVTAREDGGVCDPEEGSCVYPTTRTNCSLRGQACQDGVCIDVDPCESVSCEVPPLDRCEGLVAVQFGAGTCTEGVCNFEETRDDCGARDAFCLDGACVAQDPCVGVTCATPPAPRCEDQTALVFAESGTCAAGICSYAPVSTDCAAQGRFCAAGTCVETDPCGGVTCTTPPTPTCDGNVLVSAPDEGTCSSGLCSYATQRIDCAVAGQFCQAGACVDVDPCIGVTCTTAPAPLCQGAVRIDFEATGTCAGGDCRYREVRQNCAALGDVCVAGACVAPDPCTGISCDAAPAGFCDLDLAVRFEAPGTCAGGRCSYTRVEENCGTVAGGYCQAGACLSADPCLGLVCNAPPSPTCEGNVAVTGANPGTCSDGSCSYPQVRRDCALEGAFCSGGTCVGTDPCLEVSCATPPANRCEADQAVQFGAGTCSGGICTYARTTEDCAAVENGYCLSGACATLDPCDGISCNTPPAPTCDGRTVVQSTAPGTCDEGLCRYGVTRLDCAATGRFCQDGTCVETDPCVGVACDAPPAARCDGDVALLPPAIGFCSAGLCSYPQVSVDCAALSGYCFGGACVDTDLCDGVTCADPPPAFCDDSTAVRWSPAGNCRAGTCLYEATRQECAATGGFCFNGACQANDPCDTLVCPTPPPAFCDGDRRVFFAGATCEGGVCGLDRQTEDCAASGQFCQAGSCVAVDPCLGVNCNAPPGPSCTGNRAILPVSPGTCSGGTCSYPTTTDDCASRGDFCLAGACVDTDPCAGVACTTPPAAVCDGGQAIAYASVGTCAFGVCSYAPVEQNCTESGGICVAGACVGTELCDGITCDSPPADRCEDGVAVAHEPGTCRLGVCNYVATRTDCASEEQFCLEGRCVDTDPCGAGACQTPPDAFCDGNVAQTFVEPATCVDGDCSFAPTPVDCGATDQFCFEGACVDRDPCLGLACLTPQDPFCDNQVAVTWQPTGVCLAGVCSYQDIRTNCAASGRFCQNGACQAIDPCAGVVCASPQAPTCDGDTVVGQSATGTCVEGVCRYNTTRTPCDDVLGGFCQDGACAVADPCDQIVCGAPPAPVCDGTRVRTFANEGTCAAGVCTYASSLVNCGPAPANFCEGDSAVRYASTAGCTDGACTWARTTTNCAADGLFCNNGQCTALDPCLGVTCNAPPDPRCADNVAIDWEPIGTCTPTGCVHEAVPTDCSDTGRFCNDGVCQAADPCAGVTCPLDPPVCDGDTSVTTTASVCAQGDCTPTQVRTPCDAVAGGFCADGACLVDDPCDRLVCNNPPVAICRGSTRVAYSPNGVCADGACDYAEVLDPCTTPPIDVCDGATAVAYAATGGCANGLCSYSTTRTNCSTTGRICLDGRCQADPCAGVTCNSPPASTCDGNTAVLAGVGQCVDGTCNYPSIRQDCTASGQLCQAGTCVTPDLCVGVTCNTPPPNGCAGTTAIRYEPLGTCSSGTCTYSSVTEPCGTLGGTCSNGTCDYSNLCTGVACNAPPTAFCEGTTAVAYRTPGVCELGGCSYEEVQTNCAAGGLLCSDGACVPEPCSVLVCNTPPVDVCIGTSIYRYAGTGLCADGECSYALNPLLDCDDLGQICELGVCRPLGPCDDVICGTPPVGSCDGEQPVRFASLGTCASGTCSYTPLELDPCGPTTVCRNGECVDPDSCQGLACTTPPAATCDGTTAIFYANAGTCEDGVCSYDTTSFDCASIGLNCNRGTCALLPDCTVGGCPTTPSEPPFCDGNTAVVPTGPGLCVDGGCEYTPVRTDCTALGRFCDAGVCSTVDPCVETECGERPPDFCENNVYVARTGAAICQAGICSWAETRTDCSALGRACRADGCTADLCEGVVCPVLPSGCEGDVVLRYTGAGVCDPLVDGECDYSAVLEREDCRESDGICVDGACVSRGTLLRAGDLAITEIHPNPAGTPVGRQWFEIRNISGVDLVLANLVVTAFDAVGDTQNYTLVGPTPLPAGAYFVFGESATAVPGGPDANWGGASVLTLSPTVGGLTLRQDTRSLAVLNWVSPQWPFRDGIAAQLSSTRIDQGSTATADWCEATNVYSGSDRGTPGAANRVCP